MFGCRPQKASRALVPHFLTPIIIAVSPSGHHKFKKFGRLFIDFSEQFTKLGGALQTVSIEGATIP